MRFVYAAIASFMLVGCVGPGADQTALKAAKDAWKVMGPEYRAYVEKDTFLVPDTKAVKLQTADLMTKLLEEATKEVK